MYGYALFGAFTLLLVGFVADTYTTLRGIQRGEANPIMAWMMQRMAPKEALIISKLGFLTVGVAAAMIWPGDVYVVVGIYIVAALHILAAVINEARG